MVVLLFSASLLLWDLHSGRPLTKHEVLAAQPAREMAQGRHWIVPMFLGVPRTFKPPTMSWLIAGSMKVLGGESEIAARLPAALSGVATAWLMALLAGRWYGSRTGLLAGLLLATSVYTLMQARLAEADMPLCAAVAAAMVVFALTCVPGAPHERTLPAWSRSAFCLRALLFHGAVGISFLLKGPVGLLFVMLACVPYALVARLRWQQPLPLRLLLHPMGVALLLVLVVAWPLSAYLSYPPILEAWRGQTLGRFSGELGGAKPFLFYFYTLPWLTLPGSLFALCALRRFRAVLRPRGLFLLLWLVGGWVMLQASAFKHKHYLIPLLPPVSVTSAIGLVDWIALRYRWQRRRPPRLLLNAGLVVLAGMGGWIAVARLAPPDLRLKLSLLTGVLCVLVISVLQFEARRQTHWQLACFFAVVWLAEWVVITEAVPRADSYRESTEFARRMRGHWSEAAARSATTAPICLFGLGETQLAFYLPLDTTRVDTPEALIEKLQAQGGQSALLVATTRRHLENLALVSPRVKTSLLDQSGLQRRETAADQLLLVALWLQPADGDSPP